MVNWNHNNYSLVLPWQRIALNKTGKRRKVGVVMGICLLLIWLIWTWYHTGFLYYCLSNIEHCLSEILINSLLLWLFKLWPADLVFFFFLFFSVDASSILQSSRAPFWKHSGILQVNPPQSILLLSPTSFTFIIQNGGLNVWYENECCEIYCNCCYYQQKR